MWCESGLEVPLKLGREEVLKTRYLSKDQWVERSRHLRNRRENSERKALG